MSRWFEIRTKRKRSVFVSKRTKKNLANFAYLDKNVKILKIRVKEKQRGYNYTF